MFTKSQIYNQLKQMGVFEKVNGILLGTFTEMEAEHYSPTIEELVIRYVGPSIPIAKTFEIGHGIDSKAIEIGKELYLYGGQR
jgi:muramoyltetrapeptide carboxypeptidase LdcA involved in peptidoglycan recycling